MKTSVIGKPAIVLALVITTCITACKKPDNPTPTPVPVASGSIGMSFVNVVGDSVLVPFTKTYTNSSNEAYTVTLLNYYISNIKLTRSDNTVYTEANSYHLIQSLDTTSFAFSLANVPYGNYTSITFMIGVDSTRNVSGAQTGALDVKYGMFWSWNSGYIMTMLNVNYKGKSYEYHIGGFSGPYSVLKTVTFSLPASAAVSATATPSIVVNTNVAKWFDGPKPLSIVAVPGCAVPGAEAQLISNNYVNAFTVAQVKNK